MKPKFNKQNQKKPFNGKQVNGSGGFKTKKKFTATPEPEEATPWSVLKKDAGKKPIRNPEAEGNGVNKNKRDADREEFLKNKAEKYRKWLIEYERRAETKWEPMMEDSSSDDEEPPQQAKATPAKTNGTLANGKKNGFAAKDSDDDDSDDSDDSEEKLKPSQSKTPVKAAQKPPTKAPVAKKAESSSDDSDDSDDNDKVVTKAPQKTATPAKKGQKMTPAKPAVVAKDSSDDSDDSDSDKEEVVKAPPKKATPAKMPQQKAKVVAAKKESSDDSDDSDDEEEDDDAVADDTEAFAVFDFLLAI